MTPDQKSAAAGSRKRKKVKRKQTRRCTKCGGSPFLGDNYFIKKCMCHEFEVMEGNDYESSE